jgi:hypothetical protein
VLYERLVKRFQTASEREAEGKAKGYGRTLEADLQRGESKLRKLKEDDQGTGFLQERFVHGLDEDFDYTPVDADEDLDTMLRRDAQDAWFDDEEPSWVHEDEPSLQADIRQGETGVQDF